MSSPIAIVVLYWVCLALATIIGFGYFRDLGDITQKIFNVKRRNMYRAIKHEYKIIGGVLLLLVLVGTLHFHFGIGPRWLTLLAIGLNLFFLIYPYVWVHVGLRNQQNTAKYYSPEEAKCYVRPETQVIVINNGEHARAHPPLQIGRPHLAGTPEGLGGENVIMSFCAMSRLGMGLVPEYDGEKIEFSVAAQASNNLILREKGSGEPVQQIYAARTCGDVKSKAGIKQWPTYLMSLRGFEKAFPKGEVFINKPSANPLLRLFDTFVELIFAWALTAHHNEEGLLFDSMEHEDDRMLRKTLVWGINIGDDSVAYTEDFVRKSSTPINVTIGDQPLVIAYDDAFESLGVFKNNSGKKISKIDFFGKSNAGELARLETVRSGLYWFIWANYFPGSDINRAGNG